MYQMVVADDEQLERMALQQTLKECVGENCRITLASNGREALEAVRRLHADIAILDIEMPGMTGLEAAQIIKEEMPQCRIVFLTAYSEFQYARQAVELGAADYLLKPCSDRQLEEVVGRLVQQIASKREEEIQQALSNRRIAHLTQHLEEQLVLTIMGGYLRADRAYSQLEELGIPFHNGVFVILCSPDGISPERIRAMIMGCGWREAVKLIMYEYDDRLHVFAASTGECNCAAVVRERLGEMCEQALTLSRKRLYCAVGTGFERLEDAQQSFFEAQTVLGWCRPEDPVRDAGETALPMRQEQPPLEELSGRGARLTQIAQEIAEYMQKNYRRDIFLQQVAQEMNYSDAYFSKLFKQCFQKNFITYLTEARIEAAKELLRNPTVNIKEIGVQVGYKDSNYFTKVFRRSTGKSPSEYRLEMLSSSVAQENMKSE